MHHSALPPAEDLKLVPLADIARGGMGMVQLCRVQGGRLDGRPLAVKRLNPAIEQEPEFVNMFLDETWITATIANPHVVKVEAWGHDDYGMFLAVELVQGVSLSRLMKESKEKEEPFAERTVANVASQICAGLAAAHELRGENGAILGLVHRDLTPGNVLVSFDGLVKIADFGIAKAEERLTSTRIGMMKGKPAYMAPEQARGGAIDARADLFALGVVMFELLTGQRPWSGGNDLEMLVNVSTKEPPKVEDLRKVSPVFSEIIGRCLRKKPDERFTSAHEIRTLLEGWRRERGFEHDDQASLSAFVVRNTEQQRAWFQQALTGKLARGGVTFMDLEARIDQVRKGSPNPQERANAKLPPELAVKPAPGAPATDAANLEEIDDSAQTKFLPARNVPMPAPQAGFGSRTVAAAPIPSAPIAASPLAPTAPSGVPSPRMIATLNMSPEEAAALSAPGAPPGSLGASGFMPASEQLSAPYHQAPLPGGSGGFQPASSYSPQISPQASGGYPPPPPQAAGYLYPPHNGAVAPQQAAFIPAPPTAPNSGPRSAGATSRSRWLVGTAVVLFMFALGFGALYMFVLRQRLGVPHP